MIMCLPFQSIFGCGRSCLPTILCENCALEKGEVDDRALHLIPLGLDFLVLPGPPSGEEREEEGKV